jgi:hypothetical protein
MVRCVPQIPITLVGWALPDQLNAAIRSRTSERPIGLDPKQTFDGAFARFRTRTGAVARDPTGGASPKANQSVICAVLM